MSRPSVATVARVLAGVGRPAMLTGIGDRIYSPDSCIAATRLAVDTFRHYGYNAAALSVCVNIYSPEFVRRVSAGEQLNAETKDEWLAAGAWNCVIGHLTEEESAAYEAKRIAEGRKLGWNGHLIAIVERKVLVDLSIEQASRPAKGINLAPMVGQPPGAEMTRFLRGEGTLGTEMAGSSVIYEAFPKDRSYLRSPDWTQPQRVEPFKRAVRLAIERA